MSKYSEMGKEELRAACRKAGVSYGKLNNDGMRKALEDKDAEKAKDQFPKEESIKPAAAIKPLATVPVEKPAKPAPRKRVPSDKEGYPRQGTQCRAVWDACDTQASNTLALPDVKWIKALASEKGWNINNTVIEYYQWRKIKGITGRSTEASIARGA